LCENTSQFCTHKILNTFNQTEILTRTGLQLTNPGDVDTVI